MRRDLVFVVAQSLALFIYARNLVLINRKKEGKSGNLAKYKGKNFVKRHFVKRFLDDVSRVVGDLNAEEIVDVGCGEGQTIRYLRERGLGVKFIGIDISEKALEIAKKEKVLASRDEALAHNEKKYNSLIEEQKSQLEKISTLTADQARLVSGTVLSTELGTQLLPPSSAT